MNVETDRFVGKVMWGAAGGSRETASSPNPTFLKQFNSQNS